MDAFVPEVFARDWIAAWNRHDVEAVLAYYVDDVVFVSPLAATVTGNPEVHGKASLRAYWNKALRSYSSPPQFLLESFNWDKEKSTLFIIFVLTDQGRAVRRCELMHVKPDGLISRSEAFAGATIVSTSPSGSRSI